MKNNWCRHKSRHTWKSIVRLWSSFPFIEESRRGPSTLPVDAALFLIISGTSILEPGFFFGNALTLVGGNDSTEPPSAVATPRGLVGDTTVTLSVLPKSLVVESC